jgi:hypothetical protein
VTVKCKYNTYEPIKITEGPIRCLSRLPTASKRKSESSNPTSTTTENLPLEKKPLKMKKSPKKKKVGEEDLNAVRQSTPDQLPNFETILTTTTTINENNL